MTPRPFRYLVTRWTPDGIQHTGKFYDTYSEANAVAEYKSEIETDPAAEIKILDEVEFLALVADADPARVNLPDNALEGWGEL